MKNEVNLLIIKYLLKFNIYIWFQLFNIYTKIVIFMVLLIFI
jgi:hypothetical protein